MSMYNDSKNMTLYDREVSLYDSKSTLASISSLDVTHDTSRTQSPSLARLNLDRSKNLDRSVEHSEILELMKEVEALKNLMQKNEAVVEDLKEENKSLTHCLNEASKIRETLSRDLEVANKKQKS
uniref:Uncharacterized protein n=1 Tax=Ciona savignyi TaxID=51511 RepID=H2Z5Z8_CIOSA